MPANSGVCTDRTRSWRVARPGSASESSASTSCPPHRILTFEHTFEWRVKPTRPRSYGAIASAFAVRVSVAFASALLLDSCEP